MATPIIIRVLPAGSDVGGPVEGPTAGGQLVEIYGDGFALPDTDPVAVTVGDVVVADSAPSVSVTFGGEEALEVHVTASNRIVVLTPPSPLSLTTTDPEHGTQWGVGAVDVVVTNLDANGDPVPGESVTLAGGYSYRQVRLDNANESDLARLVRTLILELNRRVISNVVFTVDTDFDSDTTSTEVDIARLPAIVLQGPRTEENRFYSLNAQQDVLEGSDVVIRRRSHTVDLRFDIVGIADHAVEALNMLTLCTRFVEDMPFISMARDPDDSSKGDARWEFDFDGVSGFELATRPNNSNLNTFSGSVVIRGFDIEGLASFERADIIGLTKPLGDQGLTLLDTERFGE